jgi:pantothenate synthetase
MAALIVAALVIVVGMVVTTVFIFTKQRGLPTSSMNASYTTLITEMAASVITAEPAIVQHTTTSTVQKKANITTTTTSKDATTRLAVTMTTTNITTGDTVANMNSSVNETGVIACAVCLRKRDNNTHPPTLKP